MSCTFCTGDPELTAQKTITITYVEPQPTKPSKPSTPPSKPSKPSQPTKPSKPSPPTAKPVTRRERLKWLGYFVAGALALGVGIEVAKRIHKV